MIITDTVAIKHVSVTYKCDSEVLTDDQTPMRLICLLTENTQIVMIILPLFTET